MFVDSIGRANLIDQVLSTVGNDAGLGLPDTPLETLRVPELAELSQSQSGEYLPNHCVATDSAG